MSFGSRTRKADKTDFNCPFCNECRLSFQREYWFEDKYECSLRCRSCGFELTGTKLLKRKRIVSLSEKNPYRKKTIGATRAKRRDRNDG